MSTRRQFLQSSFAAAAVAGAQQRPASDKIRIATIGFGGMGMGDTKYAVSVPGVELAAVCDIYDGRLTRAKEVYGDQIFTTRDYVRGHGMGLTDWDPADGEGFHLVLKRQS